MLISDIDVAWLRDPIPFFLRYPKADILVSTDMLRSETKIHPDQKKHMARVNGPALSPSFALLYSLQRLNSRSVDSSDDAFKGVRFRVTRPL